MSKLGEISGVKAFLSDKEYSEYKGTLQAQLEEKDKEIEKYLEKIGQQDCKIMRAIETLNAMKHSQLLFGGRVKNNIDKVIDILKG